jgi:periplasmic divalent cation tolerance protein
VDRLDGALVSCFRNRGPEKRRQAGALQSARDGTPFSASRLSAFVLQCHGTCDMKTSRQYAIALVTAPDLKVARRLARVALQARRVACVNLVPNIESHYWWQGKLERSAEVLLIFKTKRAHLVSLEKLVLANHPYDTPEFVVLGLTGGNERYFAWLSNSAKAK